MSDIKPIEQTVSKTSTIYQRIFNVMMAISYIKKDTDVMGRFKAVSHDKVISSVRPHLIDAGIVITTSQSQIENPFIAMPTDKDENKQLYRAVYTVSFVNVYKPEDRVSIEIEAHSFCTDDKGPGKTLSYAVKMAILKIFCIETGENDESQNTLPESEKEPLITKWQASALLLKAEGIGAKERVLTALNVQSFNEIPAAKLEYVTNRLKG